MLQGKINYLTKKKDVERSNSTGKLTKAGGKNSRTDIIYAKGAVVRVSDSSDDKDETQLPKRKKAQNTAFVAKAGNLVITVTASQSKKAMTLNTGPTATQATSQPQTSGNSAPSATQVEDMLKTARQQSNSTPLAEVNTNDEESIFNTRKAIAEDKLEHGNRHTVWYTHQSLICFSESKQCGELRTTFLGCQQPLKNPEREKGM